MISKAGGKDSELECMEGCYSILKIIFRDGKVQVQDVCIYDHAASTC